MVIGLSLRVIVYCHHRYHHHHHHRYNNHFITVAISINKITIGVVFTIRRHIVLIVVRGTVIFTTVVRTSSLLSCVIIVIIDKESHIVTLSQVAEIHVAAP